METLIIDRKTLPEPMYSFFGTERIKVSEQGTAMLLTPDEDCDVIDDGSLAYLFRNYVDDGIREPIVDFGDAVGDERW